MKPTETANTRDIFLEALDLPASERAAFVNQACANNSALREHVEKLLAEHETIADFLDAPAATPVLNDGGAKPGDQIGHYRLLQQIGEGGAGVVFMAEQAAPVRRRVALKVLKLGMDTRHVVARFEAERQALAMMDHANIAVVFDGGATESGRPYFVMELVRGTPITTYCDQHNLSVEARLKLFTQVCHAIQHAHQKGVIHRDIKPSNILVTESEGGAVPKVIDFGIAKAIEEPLTDKTLFTEFRSLIGTPAYMSPEQLDMSGADVDTRSDIYSLGVLLYEILTGETPFTAKSLVESGVDEFRRAVREVEPDRPSTRVTRLPDADLTTTATARGVDTRTLERKLRGELDWIAMKCLEKDRSRRYATVNDLAEDVQRFLHAEPVLARAPTTSYRVQKFLRRHQLAVGAAAIVILALITASIVSVRQAANARQAMRRAEAESARAQHNEARALLNEYVADITLAHQALSAGNFGRAHTLLAKHKPAAGEPDLRGFEWGYLNLLTQGDPHEALFDSGEAVRSVAFSNDGKLIAIGSRDKAIVLNATNRAIVGVSTGAVFSVAFDGKRLFLADPFSIRVVELTNFSERTLTTGVGAPISISPDGKNLAGASREGVRLFQINPWNSTRTLPRTFGPLAFSPDGTTLATAGRNNLSLWTLGSAATPTEISNSAPFGFFHQFAQNLTFSPDGARLFAAQDRLIKVFYTKNGGTLATAPADGKPLHSSQITATALSPDGQILATASWDHSIQLWDANKYTHLRSLKGHLNEVWSIAFSGDGKHILSGAKDGGVFLWPVEKPPDKDVLKGDWQPVAFSADEKLLMASHRRTGAISLIEIETERIEQIIEGAAQQPRFGPFGPRVATSADLNVMARQTGDRIEVIDRKLNHKRSLKTEPFSGFALSPDGNALVITARNAATFVDLQSNTNIALPSPAERAIFTPDSQRLILLQRESPATIWNCATRAIERAFPLETPAGFACAISPDGRLLAAGAVPELSNTIDLIDLVTGKTVATLAGHKQGIGSVAFSADGKTLISTSSDGALKLWNVPTRQEILTLPFQAHSVVFSPRGRYLVFNTRVTNADAIQIIRSKPN
ncbi:MAG TPA: protein kinase [Verrucomicrobiae bacterium]|nr:protein kinase [Verrucomicrobiae bacterium]